MGHPQSVGQGINKIVLFFIIVRDVEVVSTEGQIKPLAYLLQ